MRRHASLPSTAAALVLVALGTLTLSALPASAQATCSFDEPTGALSVTLAGSGAATLGRSGTTITLDGTACGTATVNNTETINVTGPGSGDDLTIDLAGGPFAPGLTTETDGGDPEIEFNVDLGSGTPSGILRIAGSDVADNFTLGAAGVNLNASEAAGDADVTIVGSISLIASGVGGDDVISAAGGAGTGGPIADVTLNGGDGADRLRGALGGCTLDGGAGADTLDYSGAATGIAGDLGAGSVSIGTATDDVSAVENITGTPFDDRLTGDDAGNVVSGLDGNDVLEGAEGDDTLAGGTGTDTADYGGAAKSVVVDLAAGTATGAGNDTLSEVEDVNGTSFHDEIRGGASANVLQGLDGNDEIRGAEGPDRVIGGDGNDSLFGGQGRDRLEGGSGKDRLKGGKGKDVCVPGPDPDSWAYCED
jgi:Ca2+-binding RTX toxin-like protein